MSDFTTLKTQTNTQQTLANVDSTPTWTDLLFGTAGQELRLCGSGAGTTTTASASWPSYLRPASVGLIPEMWAFTADAVGLKMVAYDTSSAITSLITHYMLWRINWDATGTFASAPLLSAWKDSTLPAASPGTQNSAAVGGDGSSFINGQTTDTSNTSYIKANAYGYGVDTSGTQQTPSAQVGGTLTATSGTANGVSPATGAWLGTWQSLQAATQWIVDAVTPKATTAGYWYTMLAFFTGPNMTGGTLLPVLGFQYTWV